MIKPATLWALFKQCDDSQWLGEICRALGRQKVELDYSQRQLISVIQADSGWMDERIEAQREKWRERKRAQRERDIGDNGDKSHSHARACARDGDYPTLAEVLSWAANDINHPDGRVYPVEWAKEWYETMSKATPPWTNVRGETVLPNWKNAMNWSWKRHLKLDKESGGGKSDSWKAGLPPGMIHEQEGYDASKLGI